MSSQKRVATLLRPKSVAVVGIGSAPGSMAERALINLVEFGFSGALYGVSRARAEVGGVPCFPSIDALPEGVDVAILSVPRDGIEEAVEACARRGVKAAIVFSAGFAEESEKGREDQERIAAFARQHGLLLAGPNCLGLINYADGVPLCFGPLRPEPVDGRRAAAIVSQSGAMMANAMIALHARELAVSHAISTGNEADLALVDYMEELLDDPAVHILCVFAEQIQRPAHFLAAVRLADKVNKTVVLLHPGRSAAARHAALSHTGALAGDYDLMAAILAHENVLHVETLEEFVDVSELLLRNEEIPEGSLAIITDSGACKGLMLDYCEKIGMPLAAFSTETLERLRDILPPFATPSNPLDTTTVILRDQAILGRLADVMLADDSVAGLMISVMPDPVTFPLEKVERAVAAIRSGGKPSVYAVIGGEVALTEGLDVTVRNANAVFSRSPERALRALKLAFDHAARRRARTARRLPGEAPTCGVADLATEFGVKTLLAKAGISVPTGGLARSRDEARDIAARIGYPVVLKVQSPDILHKTEAGGVVVGISDADYLGREWDKMSGRLSRERPEAAIDGYLVEAMGPAGVEFVIGAKRDPEWGVVMLAGLGGIWLEILKDLRLFPADLDRAEIEAELRELAAAPILSGARGHPPLDMSALVDAVTGVAAIMEANSWIREFDINPLVVYPDGCGLLALDGLAVG